MLGVHDLLEVLTINSLANVVTAPFVYRNGEESSAFLKGAVPDLKLPPEMSQPVWIGQTLTQTIKPRHAPVIHAQGKDVDVRCSAIAASTVTNDGEELFHRLIA